LQNFFRFRIPALFCALSVLCCELISRPFADMGVCDDATYAVIVKTVASTGHIVYNGWATAMLGWQLYLAAAFVKLFGYSLTTVRMSTVFTAMAIAFVLQRTLVRANISERNATIGTLAFVLSPLYLMLSATFMTDIYGVFALVICLYGCLRALQSTTGSSSIAWLCFAVATNAVFGTARQVAWLGILVMVPSTLWLLRSRRSVLVGGTAATLAGTFFVLACMRWFSHQPYSVPLHVLPASFPLSIVLWEFIHALLEFPFLLLPLAAVFLPEIRRSRPRIVAIVCTTLAAYFFLSFYPSHIRHSFLLQPTLGNWVSVEGLYETVPKGDPPDFLSTSVRALVTIISLGGLLGVFASLLRGPQTTQPTPSPTAVSWKQLFVLLVPHSIAYCLLLLPLASAAGIYDRYFPTLIAIAMLCLVRCYQDYVQPKLPISTTFLVAIMAVYAIAATHNMFALDRARVALAAELRANNIPDTAVDNGWEYNFSVELQHAPAINFPAITNPQNFYSPTPPLPAGRCIMFWYNYTPHIRPLYSTSFDPNACYGPAPFAPVHYSRWLASQPGTLYVVNFLPPKQQPLAGAILERR